MKGVVIMMNRRLTWKDLGNLSEEIKDAATKWLKGHDKCYVSYSHGRFIVGEEMPRWWYEEEGRMVGMIC